MTTLKQMSNLPDVPNVSVVNFPELLKVQVECQWWLLQMNNVLVSIYTN